MQTMDEVRDIKRMSCKEKEVGVKEEDRKIYVEMLAQLKFYQYDWRHHEGCHCKLCDLVRRSSINLVDHDTAHLKIQKKS